MEPVAKTLLILSGGGAAAEAARCARAMGHAVVIADGDPQAPAFAFADSCLIADSHGALETAAAAERYSRKIRRLDGVLCAAHVPLTAAAVGARLRLPGLPQHVAELLADRLAIRRAFRSAGIPAPWHAEIATAQELQRAAIARGRALMVRPVEHRGAHGVQDLRDGTDPGAAFAAARAASPQERVIVEEIPEGRPLEIAGLMADGECHTEAEPLARETLRQAAAALGIADGVVQAELVMRPDGVLVCEFSAQLGGGAPLHAAIRQALGETV